MEWKIRFASDLLKEKEKVYMVHIDTISDLKKLAQIFDAYLIINFVKNEIIIDDDFIK